MIYFGGVNIFLLMELMHPFLHYFEYETSPSLVEDVHFSHDETNSMSK
jgi:hypothetical protein